MTGWRDAIKVALALLRVQERAMDAEIGILLDRSGDILDQRAAITAAISALAGLVDEPAPAASDKPVEDLPGDVTPSAVPPGVSPGQPAAVLAAPGGTAPTKYKPVQCRWCDARKDPRGIRTHERLIHKAEYREATRTRTASPQPAPDPVPIVPRRPNPIERSPIANQAPKGPAGFDGHKPGPDRPWVCSCGQGFRTAGHWANHRKGLPEKEQRAHRLVEQPVAQLVPTGLPAPVNDIARARAAAFDATDDGPDAA